MGEKERSGLFSRVPIGISREDGGWRWSPRVQIRLHVPGGSGSPGECLGGDMRLVQAIIMEYESSTFSMLS